MRLLINVAGNISGGSMQIAISFINECIKHTENEYYVLLGVNMTSFIDTTKFPSNFTFYNLPSLKFFQQHKVLSKIEKRVHPDVVFTVFGPAYWRPKSPHIIGFATAHHLSPESPFWDVISLKDRLEWKLKIATHRKYVKWECDAIVAETQDVEQRCHRFFGDKKQYFTVSNTCNSVFYDVDNQSTSLKLPQRKQSELRLLTLSKYYRHKNFESYPQIIDQLHKRGYYNIKFVTTLAPVDYNRIFGSQYLDTALNIGPIPICDCPSLYNECDAMFLPTMLESFSASYPEAMVTNKPILTSHYEFAISVCGSAAIYFDPTKVDDIVEKIITFANNVELREDLIERGRKQLQSIPSAEQRAKNYLDICQSLIRK